MTKFLFEDGEYEFWIVRFLTGRPEMIIRVPEGQAPMVRFEAIKRERWELYKQGKTRESLSLDILQDPWESCRRVEWKNAKDMELATKWLQVCMKTGNAFHYTGYVLNGEQKIVWPEEQKTLDFC